MLAGLVVLTLSATPPDSPGQFHHRVKLQPLILPPSGQAGLLITARVNGGPPLRLLLDSGAESLVLDKKSAAKSGCQGGSALDLIGAGATPTAAKTVQADTVGIDDILLRHVDVVVIGTRFLDGVDGVMPLALFAGYVIRLDLQGRNLELFPYSAEWAVAPGTVSHAVADNRLLFVKGIVNDSYEGLFVLDTGATYNAISINLARKMNSTAALTRPVSMQGGTAQMDVHFVPEILRLRVGSHDLQVNPVVAVDLSLASRYHWKYLASSAIPRFETVS